MHKERVLIEYQITETIYIVDTYMQSESAFA